MCSVPIKSDSFLVLLFSAIFLMIDSTVTEALLQLLMQKFKFKCLKFK